MINLLNATEQLDNDKVITQDEKINDSIQNAKMCILKESNLVQGYKKVEGINFNEEITLDKYIESLNTTGFQATHLGKSINIINTMLYKRKEYTNLNKDFKIFLGYTSNQISSGLRDIICYQCKYKLIDIIVTTAGGIEEDLIKCLKPTFIGEFTMDGKWMHQHGFNRIGNLFLPNKNYCEFETWLTPILDKLLIEQDGLWTPSQIISRLGMEINNEESIQYWCYKNSIPIFCPALTDGSIGDMIFFHSINKPGLKIDIVDDLRKINTFSINSDCTGSIILGSGIIKHHICNANLMRNGMEYAVYINTAQEYDGSDSGATPDEAISWGKIHHTASHIKVHADATIVFPLIVAATFAKFVHHS